MHVPKEAMQRIFILHREAEAAAQRRDDAMALAFAWVGAEPGSQIVLREDGSGLVVVPNVGKDSESVSENATNSPWPGA